MWKHRDWNTWGHSLSAPVAPVYTSAPGNTPYHPMPSLRKRAPFSSAGDDDDSLRDKLVLDDQGS
jgi:hypothetical protein